MTPEELIGVYQETLEIEQKEDAALREAEIVREFDRTAAALLVERILARMEVDAYQRVADYRGNDAGQLLVLHAEWRASSRSLDYLKSSLAQIVEEADEILADRGLSLEEWRLKRA